MIYQYCYIFQVHSTIALCYLCGSKSTNKPVRNLHVGTRCCWGTLYPPPNRPVEFTPQPHNVGACNRSKNLNMRHRKTQEWKRKDQSNGAYSIDRIIGNERIEKLLQFQPSEYSLQRKRYIDYTLQHVAVRYNRPT